MVSHSVVIVAVQERSAQAEALCRRLILSCIHHKNSNCVALKGGKVLSVDSRSIKLHVLPFGIPLSLIIRDAHSFKVDIIDLMDCCL